MIGYNIVIGGGSPHLSPWLKKCGRGGIMSDTKRTLAIMRDEFQAASRQGAKLYHAMYRYEGVSQFQPNNVPPHCGGPCIHTRLDGFEAAFYYRQPGTTFCRTQLTEFFRLAEAASRCIDALVLPTYPSDDRVHLRGLLDSPDDPRDQWLSAVYRIAWKHPGALLRAEPSINGKWVGSELLYAQHLLDECAAGARWTVCVPLSPDVFLASALAIDVLLGVTAKERDFMEMAIEEARKSVGEDNRTHPKVGAVVVKNGAVLATAFRGELGKGEHAEYTALERKLPDATLAGTTVYATLEPCTSRNHPKTPCAQRLIDRKVKRVVIGMLDPNPRICGKGERLLRDHGIEVERFPHELVMKLEEMNRAFVKIQSQAADDPPKPPLQRATEPDTGLRDLQRRFLEAQDRFPREVSFALVMIPHDERQAWQNAKAWFDDMPLGPPRQDGWRCLAFAIDGDTPQTITIPASERTDGGTCPLLYSLDSWKCWLLRQSTTAAYPGDALNMFHSLADDACRLLDLRDCGMIMEGRHIGGKRGEYQHLLRWSVEQLPAEECKKLTWLDPPHEQFRTTFQPDRTPRRWVVEMPCVFAAVAHALERHIGGLGKPWPSA
jgi:pyrimidine deaminase RibD-like protein